MNLKDLKSCIDQAYKNAGKCSGTALVEVWLGKKSYRIKSVSQFGVVPDVTLMLDVGVKR